MRKYSGKEVNRAGDKLLNPEGVTNDSELFSDAMDVLSYWRVTHIIPLENAFFQLQVISLKIDKKAIFAKRLKRYISIIDKLSRFESMKLKNMQDIGGCRVVLSSEKKLRKIVRELKKSPEFEMINGKYRHKDYIKSPKNDGYRSYHIVGKFNDTNNEIKNIEIQLRTRVQHYWATALEIVDLFTGQALKSNQGDEEWKNFFHNTSIQFSTIDSIHMHEQLEPSLRKDIYVKMIDGDERLLQTRALTKKGCDKLKVFEKLQAYSNSLKIIDDTLKNEEAGVAGYVLLKIDTTHDAHATIDSSIFKKADSLLAEESYIKAEKEAASRKGIIVALVSTAAVGDIQEAYPNYFADSTMFLEYLNIVTQSHNRSQKKITNA